MSDQAVGADRVEWAVGGDRRRWLALYVLCAGMMMIVLDSTIVNVALPSIQADLGFAQSDLAWVVNAYLISFGGLLLLAGRIGDLVGQRRIFLLGLTVFTAASLACALAGSQGVLVGGRFAQGIGGALTSAVILGMIVTMFPEPTERARAIGIYTFVAVAGGSVGLLAGGVLTEAMSWQWIFFVNVPIGLGTGFLALRLVDDAPGVGWSRGADIVGAVLLTAGLMIGVYAIIGVGDNGWGSYETLVLGALAIVLLGSFLLRQARVSAPLLPLRIFRSRRVAAANAVQALLVVGLFGFFFLSALYMQGILGYGPLEVGLAFLPWTIAMAGMSLRLTARLMDRFGPGATVLPGMALVAVGLVLFARTPLDATYAADVLPSMALMGAGAGLVFPSLMTLAMSSATPSDSGLASGLVNTSMQVGGALGLAVLATLATDRTEGLLADGEPLANALNGGYHLAYVVGAVLVVAATAVTLVALRSTAVPSTAPRSTAPRSTAPAAEPASVSVAEDEQPVQSTAHPEPSCCHCLQSGRLATVGAASSEG